MARARVHTDRFMLNWGWVQPRSPGSFNWSGPDRLIGALAAHGIRAVPDFWGNPGWVWGSPARPPLARPRDMLAWRAFLRAAVARYGPDGAFWRTRYRQLHPQAAPLPITSWQIWNEPNLRKYFAPKPSPARYARLLRVSRDAIVGADPEARILLAGMPGYGQVTAWRFLRRLYATPEFRTSFSAAALHPYARNLDQFRYELRRFRTVMSNHGDAARPLWITELAWGSALPDRFGINQGPVGQSRMLRAAFRLILTHRAAWNVQRLFWFHWRDPPAAGASPCSFCSTAGLVKYGRGPKPAYWAFTGFTADATPPRARVVSGPAESGFVADPTPTFRFASSEAGSTFQCRYGSHPFLRCASPFTPPQRLADGPHAFAVRAIDAAGNVGPVVRRSFTVDTVAPRATITSGPAKNSASSNANPSFAFASPEPGVTFRCKLDAADWAPCTSPHAVGRLAAGLHRFAVVATDQAGNSGAAAIRAWTVDTGTPTVRISSRPPAFSSNPSPSFRFSASAPGSSFRCVLDSGAAAPCTSPHVVGPLADGAHAFRVRAIDSSQNRSAPAEVRFTVDTAPPRLRIEGRRRVRTRRRRAAARFLLRASEPARLECRIASRSFEPCSRRVRTPKLGRGPHTLEARATDRAGNVVRREARFRIVVRRRTGHAGRRAARLGDVARG